MLPLSAKTAPYFLCFNIRVCVCCCCFLLYLQLFWVKKQLKLRIKYDIKRKISRNRAHTLFRRTHANDIDEECFSQTKRDSHSIITTLRHRSLHDSFCLLCLFVDCLWSFFFHFFLKSSVCWFRFFSYFLYKLLLASFAPQARLYFVVSWFDFIFFNLNAELLHFIWIKIRLVEIKM